MQKQAAAVSPQVPGAGRALAARCDPRSRPTLCPARRRLHAAAPPGRVTVGWPIPEVCWARRGSTPASDLQTRHTQLSFGCWRWGREKLKSTRGFNQPSASNSSPVFQRCGTETHRQMSGLGKHVSRSPAAVTQTQKVWARLVRVAPTGYVTPAATKHKRHLCPTHRRSSK